MSTHTFNIIESSCEEYAALSEAEWRKDYFNEENGGFVATHIYKERDDLRRSGIAAEVRACFDLAKLGKHVLRLPENIPNLIDNITIEGIPYRELLKFKPGEIHPRGYPDAYFDGQTWDFKTSLFSNDDTLRHRIKDGRKADNVIFLSGDNAQANIRAIHSAIGREYGSRLSNSTWNELPNVYYLFKYQLIKIWEK